MPAKFNDDPDRDLDCRWGVPERPVVALSVVVATGDADRAVTVPLF